MKAVILAAGKGTRIQSISNGFPKSLIPFQDKTILGFTLDKIKNSRIRSIIVVTGYNSDLVMDYVKKNWDFDYEFVHNKNYNSTNVLFSFYLSIPLIKNEDFLFLHADTIFSQKIINDLLKKLENNKIVFPVDFKKCGEEEMKVNIRNGFIVELSKKIDLDKTDGEFLGLAVIKNELIKDIKRAADQLFSNKDYSFFFEAAIQKLITDENLKVQSFDIGSEPWIEIDTPEDFYNAVKLFP